MMMMTSISKKGDKVLETIQDPVGEYRSQNYYYYYYFPLYHMTLVMVMMRLLHTVTAAMVDSSLHRIIQVYAQNNP